MEQPYLPSHKYEPGLVEPKEEHLNVVNSALLKLVCSRSFRIGIHLGLTWLHCLWHC